ncbi:indeterminate-domain [Thalictrum thalictroides]|uniref:Indeterminate-domain n=1 Tax=Thalictrum thalictroides TaxID=46969 RepID=A0A7J6XA22_THATH|nr:indeterminate-domain [Thalictrum thalictroides]
MLRKTFSNSSLSAEANGSSGTTRVHDFNNLSTIVYASSPQQLKKRRNLPGNPEPNAEVIALSPRSLLASNRFVCEVCNKGFQRDQNLQLHRRGHNLPWKLNKRINGEYRKKVYVCPEPSCVHHNPSRALGDLTGIKKHFCRKHREKRLRCHKCSKMYAVESDYKAHLKVCGTRETICDCGRIFSRKDKYEAHRPFCDALAREAGRVQTTPMNHFPQQNQNHDPNLNTLNGFSSGLLQHIPLTINSQFFLEQPTVLQPPPPPLPLIPPPPSQQLIFPEQPNISQSATNTAHMSASCALQKVSNVDAGSISAAHIQSMGHIASSFSTQFDTNGFGQMSKVGAEGGTPDGISKRYWGLSSEKSSMWKDTDLPTRDFLGLAGEGGNKDFHSFTTKAIYFATYDRERLMLRAPGLGYGDAWAGDY